MTESSKPLESSVAPQPSAQPTGNVLGLSPRGFSESLQQQTLELKHRVQTGQASLAEIQKFLASATSDLDKTREKRNVPFKREDVDFF